MLWGNSLSGFFSLRVSCHDSWDKSSGKISTFLLELERQEGKNTENPEGKKKRRRMKATQKMNLVRNRQHLNPHQYWFSVILTFVETERRVWMAAARQHTNSSGRSSASGNRDKCLWRGLDNTVWQVKGNLRRRKIEKGSDFAPKERWEKRHKFSRKTALVNVWWYLHRWFFFLVLLNFSCWRFSP